MALGAQRGDVMRQVVRRGLALTVIGLAIGLIVATMTMRSVRGLLFGVTPLGSNDVPGCFPTVRMCRGARVVCAGRPAARPASIGLSRCATNRRSVSIEPDLPFESSYNPSSSAVTLSPGTRLGSTKSSLSMATACRWRRSRTSLSSGLVSHGSSSRSSHATGRPDASEMSLRHSARGLAPMRTSFATRSQPFPAS